MQAFSTSDGRHHFSVDRHRYYLPPFEVDDIQTVVDLGRLPPKEQAEGFRNAVASRACAARPGWLRILTGYPSPRKAVLTLSMKQVADLFKAWAGETEQVPLGESSGSVD